MANIPSTNSKIQIEETTFRAPVSETLTQRMGGSINYALDQVGSTSSALAAETAARIAADNTINGKLVVRQIDADAFPFLYSFTSAGVFNDGDLMATQSLSIPNNGGWLLLQLQAENGNTAGRQASYLDVDFLSSTTFGTQTLCDIAEDGGEHFGTVIYMPTYSSPLNVRIRQFASPTLGGLSQRWTWTVVLKYATLNTTAVFGS